MPTNLATLTSTGYVWMPGPRDPRETSGDPEKPKEKSWGDLSRAMIDWDAEIPVCYVFVYHLST